MENIQIKYIDKKITDEYKNFKSHDNIMRSCSLSTRAGKGSVANAKDDYSPKEEKLFEELMEINGK